MTDLGLGLLVAGGLAFGGDTFLLEPRPAVKPERPLVVNFEGSRCAHAGATSHPDGGWTLCAPESSPRWLAQSGVVAASLENNHAADGEANGTAAMLQDAGLAVPSLDRPFCHQGLCVVSWQDLRDDLPAALESVRRLSAKSPVLVLVHQSRPAVSERREVLRKFADAGARLVLASGSHRVEPLERHGNALLFHGLGDYAFDCACSSATRGLVVAVDPRTLTPTAWLVKTSKGPSGLIGERVRDEAELVRLAEASRELGAAVAVVDGTLVVLPP
jgi:hypothetical protein